MFFFARTNYTQHEYRPDMDRCRVAGMHPVWQAECSRQLKPLQECINKAIHSIINLKMESQFSDHFKLIYLIIYSHTFLTFSSTLCRQEKKASHMAPYSLHSALL